MPILSTDYMGVYKVVFIDGKYRLLDSFSEKKTSTVSDEKFLFADIGNHVVKVSSHEITASIKSDILLFQKFDNTANLQISDAYSLGLENLAVIREPIASNNNLEFILDDMSITISSSEISTDLSLISLNFPQYALDGTQLTNGGFNVVTDSVPLDFYGRTAKFYDCIFSIFGNDYLVAGGSMKIDVDVEKEWLINNNQDNPYDNLFPKYAISGYSASGSIELVVRPDQYEFLKLASIQPPGIFAPYEKQIKFKVFDKVHGDKILNLGDIVFFPKISFNLDLKLIRCSIEFTTLFRRTSSISF